MTGSLRGYAKHRKEKGLVGGSLSAVQKAIASNRITKGSDGKIEFDRADREWEQNLNRHKATTRRGEKGVALEGSLPPDGNQSGRNTGNFLEAQCRHEWAKAQKAELDLRLRQGELVEVEETRMAWSKHILTAQDRMLGIAGKLAPRVIAAPSVLEAQEMIEGEIRQALTSLSEYQPNAE